MTISPKHNGRRGRVWLSLIAAALLCALFIPDARGAPDTTPAAGLQLLGKLQQPSEFKGLFAGTQKIILVDAPGRRLFYLYQKESDSNAAYLRVYDMRSVVPKFIKEGRIGTVDELPFANNISPNTVAFDGKRGQLMILSDKAAVAGCTGDPTCGAVPPAPVRILIVDVNTFKREGLINVQEQAPGFAARGITFSQEDDRIYLFGEMEPGGQVFLPEFGTGRSPRAVPVAVAALAAGTGKLAWIRVIPECDVPMSSLNLGAAIYRSRDQDALYFACVRPFVYPGTSGIFRLWISPKAALVDAVGFRLEVFPISGVYSGGGGVEGVAAFDYGSDRFYMQSVSETAPGVWVFDGRLGAWAGFIGAPDSTDQYNGVNQDTGRYYLGGSGNDPLPGYLVVSDGRMTPVPQGHVFTLTGGLRFPVFTDPIGHRIFVGVARTGTNGIVDWFVYRDLVPASAPPRPVDYDSLTNDIPEGPDTFSTYSGSVNGYGAQVLLVGGLGGLTNTICGEVTLGGFDCGTIKEAVKATLNFSPSVGDRAVFAARVPSLDVRNVGVASSARSLALDPISDGEYQAAVKTVAQDARDQTKNDATGDRVESQLTWPYEPLACLDSGAKMPPDETTGPGGDSKVGCDFAASQATATTSFEALSAAGVSIGFSSFQTEAHRDPKLGIVTSTTAEARAIQIAPPAGGSVSIGRILATAVTAARGRRGGASVSWTRTFEHVLVKDANGAIVYRCAAQESCDLDAAVAAMNDALKTRIRIDLPQAQKTATPEGAFAGVQESPTDYYNGLVSDNETNRAVAALQITIFNDASDKSRVLIELAAIQASSIYGISPIPIDVPVPTIPGIDIPGITIPGPVPTLGDGGGTQAQQPTNPIARVGRTALFLIRSPKEALLFGLTILLFAGAVAAAWRRSVLTAELAGNAAKNKS